MLKKLFIFIVVFATFSMNIFCFSIKFDAGAKIRGTGFLNGTSPQSQIYDLGIFFDNIFVADNSAVYGGAIGLILGVGFMDVTNTDFDIENFGMKNFYIGVMGRFYPVENISIGVGPKFTGSAGTQNENNGKQDDGIQMETSILIEAKVTRFFGNFGFDIGVHSDICFTDGVRAGLGGSIGIRYRFNPY